MSNEELNVPQHDLVQAWREALPSRLHSGDQAEVLPDEADDRKLHVRIQASGRQSLEFDFTVRYVDSREIAIELSDVERDGVSVDERSDVMQELIIDYRRHLHECAQSLHDFTHA